MEILKQAIEINVKINHEFLADHVFNHSVLPMLTKLTEKIPGQIDDIILEKNVEFLKTNFADLFENAVKELERKLKTDLDGNGEIA